MSDYASGDDDVSYDEYSLLSTIWEEASRADLDNESVATLKRLQALHLHSNPNSNSNSNPNSNSNSNHSNHKNGRKKEGDETEETADESDDDEDQPAQRGALDLFFSESKSNHKRKQQQHHQPSVSLDSFFGKTKPPEPPPQPQPQPQQPHQPQPPCASSRTQRQPSLDLFLTETSPKPSPKQTTTILSSNDNNDSNNHSNSNDGDDVAITSHKNMLALVSYLTGEEVQVTDSDDEYTYVSYSSTVTGSIISEATTVDGGESVSGNGSGSVTEVASLDGTGRGSRSRGGVQRTKSGNILRTIRENVDGE